MSQYQSRGINQNAAVILSYQDRTTGDVSFLLGRHSGHLMFPGGQVDRADSFGRTEEQTLAYAAKRELREETGVDLERLGHVKLSFMTKQYYKPSADGRYPEKHVNFYHAHLGRLDHNQIKHFQDIIKHHPKDDLNDVQFISFHAIKSVKNGHKTKYSVLSASGHEHGINAGNYLEMSKCHRNILTGQMNVPQLQVKTKPSGDKFHSANQRFAQTPPQIKIKPSPWFVMRSFFNYVLSMLRNFLTLRWLFQAPSVKTSAHSMFNNNRNTPARHSEELTTRDLPTVS